MRYDDRAAGTDVALEAALTDDTSDEADDERFREYWERESQQGTRAPFWYAGLAYPRPISRSLLQQGLVSSASEIQVRSTPPDRA